MHFKGVLINIAVREFEIVGIPALPKVSGSRGFDSRSTICHFRQLLTTHDCFLTPLSTFDQMIGETYRRPT